VTFQKAVGAALSAALFRYLEGCPKGNDRQRKSYRLFPERQLKLMISGMLSVLEQTERVDTRSGVGRG